MPRLSAVGIPGFRPGRMSTMPAARTESSPPRSGIPASIGQTPVRIAGRANRGAVPANGRFPPIVASHGQPGTRFQGAADKYLLTLAASTTPLWSAPPRCRKEDYWRCWEPAWDPERSHDLARHFASAFFLRFLQNDLEAGIT